MKLWEKEARTLEINSIRAKLAVRKRKYYKVWRYSEPEQSKLEAAMGSPSTGGGWAWQPVPFRGTPTRGRAWVGPVTDPISFATEVNGRWPAGLTHRIHNTIDWIPTNCREKSVAGWRAAFPGTFSRQLYDPTKKKSRITNQNRRQSTFSHHLPGRFEQNSFIRGTPLNEKS